MKGAGDVCGWCWHVKGAGGRVWVMMACEGIRGACVGA